MVAKITLPHSVLRALNYNEKKLEQGKAECLYAGNYLREAGDMNFYQKLEGLENRNSLNDRATTNTLHISLNFDPSENFTKEKLTEIATRYMEKIGFEEQPFLVYEHLDAGHPHLHIVTSTIQGDGSRIPTHNIGKERSEKARKEIEVEYGLVKAQSKKEVVEQRIKPLEVQKLVYGKEETKRGITNVLDAVIPSYKYTSLAELNAVLKQFNVVADRGKEEGRIYKEKGLVYRMLDEKGKKIGVPIKGSSIYSKPTLANLEKNFALNEAKREPHLTRVQKAIDEAFSNRAFSMKDFMSNLRDKGIYTVLRQNEEGRIYGITFVDNVTKSVFNGSDLGKGYSAAAIQGRITATNTTTQNTNTATQNNNLQQDTFFEKRKQINDVTNKNGKEEEKLSYEKEHNEQQSAGKPVLAAKAIEKGNDLLEQLTEPKQKGEGVPVELLKKKRKKKRNLKL